MRWRDEGASIALACRAFGVTETCYRYGPKLRAENEEIADLLNGLTNARKTWGFGLCFLHLRNVRHEWLDQYIIETIEEAQDHATQWL
jgi:putative transposase